MGVIVVTVVVAVVVGRVMADRPGVAGGVVGVLAWSLIVPCANLRRILAAVGGCRR